MRMPGLASLSIALLIAGCATTDADDGRVTIATQSNGQALDGALHGQSPACILGHRDAGSNRHRSCRWQPADSVYEAGLSQFRVDPAAI